MATPTALAADIVLAGRPQGSAFIGFSLDLMQETIQSARNRSIAIAAVEIILSILATIALGLYLTRNLSALAEAAARVGEGHFDVVVPVQRQDEVGGNQAGPLVNQLKEGVLGIGPRFSPDNGTGLVMNG